MKKTALALSLSLLSGCQLLDNLYQDSLDPEEGQLSLPGLISEVQIRRDDMGIPAIKAQNLHDLTYATGYAMASDRLAQMYTMSLLAQGRLAEMAGPVALDMDKYMRTLGITPVVQEKYSNTSDEIKTLLGSFSDGVNAYIEKHKDSLPLDFDISGYTPEPWQPENSIYMLSILNLGVAFNAHEEIAYLNLARVLGKEKAAWLVPTYPDEALPFLEAQKLAGVDLNLVQQGLDQIASVQNKIMQTTSALGVAASNNWAVHKSRTANNASIVANDTHLIMSQPPVWMMINLDSPEYHAAGVAVAGVPAIVAGFNGDIAWGETMVMADSQDIFLEQLKEIEGKTHYLFKGEWLPVKERVETFKVRGEPDTTMVVKETHHGPLLNQVIQTDPAHVIMMVKSQQKYGLALSWTATEPDDTIEGFYNMGRAKTMADAKQALSKVGYIHLNVIYGDKDNIAWQVTGNYPVRGKGDGLLPAPGWTGEYDWQGFVPFEQFPAELNPQRGFIGTANNRPENADAYDYTLSNSWYFPERGERIKQLLQENDQHTFEQSIAMQADHQDLVVVKIQKMFKHHQQDLQQAINKLPESQKNNANKALKIIMEFDGNMQVDSAPGAVLALFDYQLTRQLFFDEMGHSEMLWSSFINMNGRSYSAYQDHLLGRDESPFWDNVKTPEVKESKPDILAISLANSIRDGQSQLGNNIDQWQLGQLQSYQWESGGTQMKPFLKFYEKWGVSLLSDYMDRGPYPAGGSRNTLNVAGYDVGKDYKVWNIPSMRLVVDFSQEEPMFLTNSGGQSGNPASPNYDSGIETWVKAENRNIPFKQDNIEKHFSKLLILQPEG